MRGNNVNIRGNITRQAEVRRTQSGSNAVSWGIAWNSSRRNDQGGYDDVPHYFDVECWASDKQLAIIEDKLVKGARCAIIDGHLEYQSWEKDGQKRSKVVIRVDDPINGLMVDAAGKKRDDYGEAAAIAAAGPSANDVGYYASDEVPF